MIALSSCFTRGTPRLMHAQSTICCTIFSHNNRFRIVFFIISVSIWCTNLTLFMKSPRCQFIKSASFHKISNFYHNKNLAFFVLRPHQHQHFDSIPRSHFSARFWQIANFVPWFHCVHHLSFISSLFSMRSQKHLVVFIFCLFIHCSLLLCLFLFTHFLEKQWFAFDSSIKISILQLLFFISSFAWLFLTCQLKWFVTMIIFMKQLRLIRPFVASLDHFYFEPSTISFALNSSPRTCVSHWFFICGACLCMHFSW